MTEFDRVRETVIELQKWRSWSEKANPGQLSPVCDFILRTYIMSTELTYNKTKLSDLVENVVTDAQKRNAQFIEKLVHV